MCYEVSIFLHSGDLLIYSVRGRIGKNSAPTDCIVTGIINHRAIFIQTVATSLTLRQQNYFVTDWMVMLCYDAERKRFCLNKFLQFIKETSKSIASHIKINLLGYSAPCQFSLIFLPCGYFRVINYQCTQATNE